MQPGDEGEGLVAVHILRHSLLIPGQHGREGPILSCDPSWTECLSDLNPPAVSSPVNNLQFCSIAMGIDKVLRRHM